MLDGGTAQPITVEVSSQGDGSVQPFSRTMVSIHDMFTLSVFWKGHERSSKSLILVVTLAGAKYSHNSYIDIRLGQGKTIVTSNLFRHG